MHVDELMPINDLERLLADAQAGRRTLDEFLQALVLDKLFISSTEEVLPGRPGVSPLLFDRAGTPMAAVFTGASRTSRFEGQIKAVMCARGCEMLRHIPPGYGIVINPGFDTGLELLPEGIQSVLHRYCGNG